MTSDDMLELLAKSPGVVAHMHPGELRLWVRRLAAELLAEREEAAQDL